MWTGYRGAGYSQYIYSFDDAIRGTYFDGEPVSGSEVEVRVTKLKNGKMADKAEVIGEMIKTQD